MYQAFCIHTSLVIEILKQVEQPSAFPARVDKLKQPQAEGAFVDIKQEEQWLEAEIKKACDLLKQQTEFQNLPGRIYSSAVHQSLQPLKGWLEKQWQLLLSLSGKKRFLAVVETDADLAEESNFSWSDIRERAQAILQHTQETIAAEAEDETAAKDTKQLIKSLFKQYDATNDVLTRRAIIHLLRNNFKVRRKPEKPEKVQEWLEGKRVEIDRLEGQVPRLPRPRNLFPEQAYNQGLEELIPYPLSDVAVSKRMAWLFHYRVLIWFFLIYTKSLEKSPQLDYCLLHQVRAEVERGEAQFFEWHDSVSAKIDQFLTIPKSLPYPIYFGGDDLRSWHLNKEGKICFKLNGLGDYLFEVRCDRRQLGIVKYFLQDWQTQNNNKGEYSGGLTLLRSAELLLKPTSSRQNVDPPSVHDRQAVVAGYKLSLHCTHDTDYLTRLGLERVRQRKIANQLKSLTEKQAKLTKQQAKLQQLEQEMQHKQTGTSAERSKRHIQRLEQIEKLKQSISYLQAAIQAELERPRPKLERLQESKLFQRADRPLYEGVAHLFIGVCLDLEQHLVVTVVDAMRRKVLTKRIVKQIMGKHYPLLQRYRHLREEHSKQRQQDQKVGRHNRLSETRLGEQVAYAIANGLVALAQQYKVSTIVLPLTKGWRERLYCQLVARAKIKCNGSKKAMARYTKQYGKRLHQWDYNRLSQAIETEAQTVGIAVIFERLELQTDAEQDDQQVNSFELAVQIAIATYDSLQA
ncbi:MAG: hypothetical protein HC895_03455 [Leptolyngbyaceae cyanobacterium SM1_3_5]|nr:hypothetical protein [Leptolyngbyaceae cyanobacterium SM1_3_5]